MVTEEYRDLLKQLVEAVRAIAPRRKPFVCFEGRGNTVHLAHDGLGKSGLAVYPADLDTLEELGAIRVRGGQRPDSLEVTPHGQELYSEWQRERADQVDAVVDIERRYLESDGFRSRHPEAYQKWRSASELLWVTTSPEHASSIGHLCREAHQLVVTSLLASARHDPQEHDAQKTKNRLRDLLAVRVTSGAIRALAEAAEAYFSAIADLAQRQEHGGQREKEPLSWDDSRRIVLHTLVIMTELDRLLAGGSVP